MDDNEFLKGGGGATLEEGEEDYEEDSDEDIEIVMDTEPKPAAQPINIKTGDGAAAATAGATGTTAAGAAAKSGAFDINLVGQVDGKDLFDLELDSIEDKPWRKPGADITDYFNFGFNEASWRAYCTKQKSLREEAMMQKRIHVFEHNDQSMEQNFFGAGMMGMQQQQKYQRIPPQQQFNPMNMMQMQMMRGMGMGAPPGMGMGGPPGMGMGPPGMAPPGMGPPGMMGGGPGNELNAFGKRPREQDDSAIKVIAGGDVGDDKPPGTDGRSDSANSRPDGPPGRFPPGGDFGGLMGPPGGNNNAGPGFQNQVRPIIFHSTLLVVDMASLGLQQSAAIQTATTKRNASYARRPGGGGGGYYNQGGPGDHTDAIQLGGSGGGSSGGPQRGNDQRSPNLQQKDGPGGGGGGGYRGQGGDRGGYYGAGSGGGGGRDHDRYHDDKRGPPPGQWDDRGGQWDRDDGRWDDPRDARDPRWQGGGRGKRDDKRR
ncbi:UNVERIFIED_CONTAM: cleavage polyadenylation factor subunit fip1 [Siphonaria sp. JEL0065]|nr:cleavage polyadenylation factor subunit fip1 [Siphonaria sp. JEL0065]